MSQASVSIAETVVLGVAFDPKNGERVARMDLNKLFASVGQLFDLLEERQIDYVLVGGIAMLAYVEGRNTQDIDLIMSRADLERLPELRIEEPGERFIRARLADLQVDILIGDKEPFAKVAKENATTRRFADRDVNCVTLEGLLLLKLYALPSLYRQGQMDKVRIYESDLSGLLSRPGVSAEGVLKQLKPYLLDSDLAELRQIVAEIEQRHREDKTRFQGDS